VFYNGKSGLVFIQISQAAVVHGIGIGSNVTLAIIFSRVFHAAHAISMLIDSDEISPIRKISITNK
jgi:hypothetical protein